MSVGPMSIGPVGGEGASDDGVFSWLIRKDPGFSRNSENDCAAITVADGAAITMSIAAMICLGTCIR